jgi:hypothetical protein
MAAAHGAEVWTQWIDGKKRRREQTSGFARYVVPDEP